MIPVFVKEYILTRFVIVYTELMSVSYITLIGGPGLFNTFIDQSIPTIIPIRNGKNKNMDKICDQIRILVIWYTMYIIID